MPPVLTAPNDRGMYSLGKRYRFAAAHTLRSPQFTEAENQRVYGHCAHPGGHGHDYLLEIILSGSALAGDVLFGRGRLDELVAEQVGSRFAYRDLNAAFGPDFITTGENLVQAVHALLAPLLPETLDLTVRLVETDKNSFAYPGRGAD